MLGYRIEISTDEQGQCDWNIILGKKGGSFDGNETIELFNAVQNFVRSLEQLHLTTA